MGAADLALAGYPIAQIARYTRASMLEVTRKDYIRTAHSKGLRERAVVVRHMIRNALIPVITILGPILAFLVTGSFIIEQFFGIPGIGQYYIKAIAHARLQPDHGHDHDLRLCRRVPQRCRRRPVRLHRPADSLQLGGSHEMATTTTAAPGRVAAERAAAGLWRDAFGRLIKNRLAIVGGSSSSSSLSSASSGRSLRRGRTTTRTPRQSSPTTAGRSRRCRPNTSWEPTSSGATSSAGSWTAPGSASRWPSSSSSWSSVIGVPIGALAGWFGGRARHVLMRFTDVIYAFPDLLFIILLSVAFRDTAFGRLSTACSWSSSRSA